VVWIKDRGNGKYSFFFHLCVFNEMENSLSGIFIYIMVSYFDRIEEKETFSVVKCPWLKIIFLAKLLQSLCKPHLQLVEGKTWMYPIICTVQASISVGYIIYA
jgi:hypothetical protein